MAFARFSTTIGTVSHAAIVIAGLSGASTIFGSGAPLAQDADGEPCALREGEWSATVAVHEGERIVAVWPGFRDQAFGAAFDIGFTTIACHLAELSSGAVVASAGRMNPQIRFGEDLMSRVSYVMMNPGGEGALIALLDCAARKEIETVVRRIEKVETTVEPAFQRHFVDAMAIPHGTADYVHLPRHVTLPTAETVPVPAARRRAGRRKRLQS